MNGKKLFRNFVPNYNFIVEKWHKNHVYPQIKGGDDNLLNLRPMQWENNRSKGDDYPNFDTSVRADGNKNVKKEGHFAVNKTLQEKLSGLYDIA